MMATLLQPSKAPPTPPQITSASVTFPRPVSEFDAGINTSAAWTNRREREATTNVDQSASDEEEEVPQKGRPARALYDFEGKPEYGELASVTAGTQIEILKEELSDGWSFASANGHAGLIPRTYWTFTADFAAAPSLHAQESSSQHQKSASSHSLTPRSGSPPNGGTTTPPPLVAQTTGEWSYLPSFRQSLLGGKSLNRFSSFVTTGAEEWVLKGSTSPEAPTVSHSRAASSEEESEEDASRNSIGEPDHHFVDSGPAWKPRTPQFRVLVHSPSKRTSTLSGAYTIYHVTSIFVPETGSGSEPPVPTRLTVHRRFSHFVFLHTALTRRLPGIALPPLPEKQYAGRFSDDFVEARRGDLERYIGRVVRHPVARYAEVVTFFLGCESEVEWRKMLPQHLSMPPAGPQFYARVFHPAFNLDADDATEAVERFQRHQRAVGKGVQGLRDIFGKIRAARLVGSEAQRLLSYSLLSLITATPLVSGVPTSPTVEEDDEEEESLRDSRKGLLNEEGAWCWRERCEDCLRLTKALQKTAESMQSIADLYDDNARRTLFASHEALKDVAHPSALYAPVVNTHKATLRRYKEATKDGSSDGEVAARCETVLNTTMAEFETYHTQKVEDFEKLAVEHLDEEILFYEQVLARLRSARRAFTPPQYEVLGTSGPRQPSIYEKDLSNPRLHAPPLTQPCPHVFDSQPMRPVSVAIQEGVGMLLGSSSSSRASVFGRFW